VKFAAKLSGADALNRRLTDLGEALVPAATDAASGALIATLEQTRESEGLNEPLTHSAVAGGRSVGATDADSIAREFGTFDANPAPWLAPSLPAARGPMRAAVATAVARAISSLRLRP
jgi:hypothetical protein